jgi:hypothetical protein
MTMTIRTEGMTEGDARERMAGLCEDVAASAGAMLQLYEAFPVFNDLQPPSFAACLPMSIDEWAAELRGAAEEWRNPLGGLESNDPAAFRRAMVAAGYEAADDSAYYCKRLGHHKVTVESGTRSAMVTAGNWVVSLQLNGAQFNRWSRANFPSVAAALRYAVAHVEAIDGVQAAFRADPLDELASPLRAALVDQMGFAAVNTGGGCYVLESRASGGHFVWISASDGPGMPTEDSWMVCAYPPADLDMPDAFLTFTSEPDGGGGAVAVTVEEAATLALSLIASREGH